MLPYKTCVLTQTHLWCHISPTGTLLHFPSFSITDEEVRAVTSLYIHTRLFISLSLLSFTTPTTPPTLMSFLLPFVAPATRAMTVMAVSVIIRPVAV